MADQKMDIERYILELESKVEILENENAQLAERGEDTLLLGILSEDINRIEDIDQLLRVGLEKIAILKNIPFCACCSPELDRLVVTKYYFLQANDQLVSTELSFPAEVLEAVRSSRSYLIRCEGDEICPVIVFETVEFLPGSLLTVSPRSVLRKPEIFCFAVPGNSNKLSHVAPLLERVIEMISTRIDTLILLRQMQELNRKLDRKVSQGTEELAQVNRELRKNEKKFRGLFNEALDMIHFVDAGGKIIDANPAELETLHYTRDEYLQLRMEDVIDPAWLNESRKALARVLAGEEVRGFETVMVAKDGSRIAVEVNAVPALEGEKVVGSMAITRNVTDRKEMEEKLLKIKKMESIGMLAGGIAHDFNNILAVILGNINFAQQLIDRKGKVFTLLSEAEKGAIRAKSLTHQLLTFSKGGDPVREVSSIVDVISDSAGFVLRGTNLRCSYTFGRDLWPAAIDRGQISQVIQNIVINARHAMPDGGEIEIACDNFIHEQPEILPLQPGRYLRLTIRDHGTGIPPGQIDKIFDPYFSTKEEGSGLGLAITHSIVAKHQGYIEVASREGEGTVFSIYLPAAGTGQEQVRKEDEEELPRGKGKIVLMDDEEMIRKIAGKMLSYAGYDALLASSGEKAIELIREQGESTDPVRAVILDLTVPGGMGGKEAAAILRKMDSGLPLIVSSGYSNDPVMSSYRDYGFSAAVVKPYKLRELVRAVQQVLA